MSGEDDTRVHFGVTSKSWMSKYFAVVAAALLLAMIPYGAAQEAVAAVASEVTQQVQGSNGTDAKIELPTAMDSGSTEECAAGASGIPSGGVKSVVSSAEPKVVKVGEFYADTCLEISSEYYEYNTSYGRFSFLKSEPAQMIVTSFYNSDTSQISQIIVQSSEFLVESKAPVLLGKSKVVNATDDTFTSRRSVVIAGEAVGFLETNIDFADPTRAPKITATLWKARPLPEPTRIVW